MKKYLCIYIHALIFSHSCILYTHSHLQLVQRQITHFYDVPPLACYYPFQVADLARYSSNRRFLSLKKSYLFSFRNSATSVRLSLLLNFAHLFIFPCHLRNVYPNSLALFTVNEEDFFISGTGICTLLAVTQEWSAPRNILFLLEMFGELLFDVIMVLTLTAKGYYFILMSLIINRSLLVSLLYQTLIRQVFTTIFSDFRRYIQTIKE